MDKTQSFNDASEPAKWSDKSYLALATWWADQLPGAGPVTKPQEIANIAGDAGMKKATDMTAETRRKMTVTAEQRQIFIDTLVSEMKQVKPRKGTYFEGGYISLGTDYDPDQPLAAALEAAGIGAGIVSLPWKTSTYLYEDGQAFAPQGNSGTAPIDYDGAPQRTHINRANIDYTDCIWYRNESRYLIADLEPGQKVFTGVKSWGNMNYSEEAAKENQVLVLPESSCGDLFERFTREDMLHPQDFPCINFIYTTDKKDYADGSDRYDGSVEKMDDQGHFRMLSKPFRALQAKEPFSVGSGSDYTVVNPGDFVTKSGEGREARYEVVRKSWLEEGARRWLTSNAAGELVNVAELYQPIKVGKPLKLVTPAAAKPLQP